jgi:CBS domain-containing protein
MLVRECLRTAPVTVPPECTIGEAARLMGEHGVGSLLVVTGDDLTGIVTDRDLSVRGIGTGRDASEPVALVMTADPVTVQGSRDIFDAFNAFQGSGVRRLPVLEENDLAGIISVDDLLVALVLELGATLTPIAQELQHPS